MIPCDLLKKIGLLDYNSVEEYEPANILDKKKKRINTFSDGHCRLCNKPLILIWRESGSTAIGINQHFEEQHPFELSVAKRNYNIDEL